jgi:competence protein ComEC
MDSLALFDDTTLRNYNVGHSIKTIDTDRLKTVYYFNDNLILLVDSLAVFNVKGFKPDYILLRNSPKVNLDRLIDSLKPKQIVADASNYKSYITRWRKTCANKKIPFHSTYEKGAFILKQNAF